MSRTDGSICRSVPINCRGWLRLQQRRIPEMDTEKSMASGSFGDDRNFFQFLKSAGFVPRVVFDVGASTGIWSEQMQQVFPNAQYHLFEPLADRFPEYQADLENRLRRLPGFVLHKTALGSHPGTERFFIARDGYGSSFLDRGQHEKVLEVIDEVIELPIRTLDDYVSENSLPVPDVIKADCQGREIAVLQGASECLHAADVLHVETWFSREYGPETPLLSEVTEWLHKRDFALIGFGGELMDSQHRLYSMDCYFFSEKLISQCWPDDGGCRVRRRVLRDEDIPEDTNT